MTKYTFFWDGPFSNWAKTSFRYCNNKFSSSEQALMWAKAMYFDDILAASMIMATDDPKKQKEYGRKVRNYDDTRWSKVRYNLMVDILYNKYSQDLTMKEHLLCTTGTILVEASPYDTIWGIGLATSDPRAQDESTWLGQNLLGKALTEVRTQLENERN